MLLFVEEDLLLYRAPVLIFTAILIPCYYIIWNVTMKDFVHFFSVSFQGDKDALTSSSGHYDNGYGIYGPPDDQGNPLSIDAVGYIFFLFGPRGNPNIKNPTIKRIVRLVGPISLLYNTSLEFAKTSFHVKLLRYPSTNSYV